MRVGDRGKSQIVDQPANPFQKDSFILDVEAKSVGDKIQLYRIFAVKDEIER
jgi:hypothetical protein